MAGDAIAELQEFQQARRNMVHHNEAHQTPTISARNWVPPIPGVIKINSDAAEGSQFWSVAAVLRNNDGNVVAARCSKELGPHDAPMAEAVALLRGMELAIQVQAMDVWVETDCARVIREIQGASSNTYVGLVVNQIKACSLHFNSVSFAHVYRDANNAAHLLAKFSLMHEDQTWIGCTPPCIQSCILSDILPHLFL